MKQWNAIYRPATRTNKASFRKEYIYVFALISWLFIAASFERTKDKGAEGRRKKCTEEIARSEMRMVSRG